jgi:hypothetical protein
MQEKEKIEEIFVSVSLLFQKTVPAHHQTKNKKSWQ